MYQLEDRILFDGAALVDVASAAASQQDQDHAADVVVEQASAPESGAPETGGVFDGLDDAAFSAGDTAAVAGDAGVNVLVVSEKLWNAGDLTGSVKDGTIVVTFDPGRTTGKELLQQIADALNGKDADSIGFLTGAAKDGELSIIADGKTSLESLADDAQQDFWRGLDDLLADSGRVDLFASELAGSDAGRGLVDALAGLTGGEVNASSDLTGDADAGGDWDLEYSTGDSAGDSAGNAAADYFDGARLDGYDHLLSGAKEIAFINPTVMDQDAIIRNLGDDVEVVFLPRENAFEFMTEYLKGCDDVDAIHLFTHGEQGKFLLGWTDGVDAGFIAEHQADFAAWGNAMNANGDILIYGCDVASGDAGAAFVDTLADATGRDIGASDNRVGYGGDWTMEYTVGKLEVQGYVFDDYFYSLKQLTVVNNSDAELASSTSINEGDLSLREAVYIAEDGDLIVFANSETLSKNAKSTGNFWEIMLVDTLVIDKNISIDGLISIPGSPTLYVQAVLNGKNASVVAVEYGSTLTEDTIVRNGVQLSSDLKSVSFADPRVDRDCVLDADGKYRSEVILSTPVAIRDASLTMLYDNQLAGIATLMNGSVFAGDLVLETGTVTDSSVLNFAWEMYFDLQVKGSATLNGGVDSWTSGNGTVFRGTELTAGSTLKAGSVLKAGTVFSGTLDGSNYTNLVIYSDRTVATGATVGTGGHTILANASSLADGSVLQGGVGDFVTLGVGTALGNGTTVRTGTSTLSGTADGFRVAIGFVLGAGTEVTAGSILPAEFRLYSAGDLNTSDYVYSGTYIYQAGDTIAAGTELLGDISISVRCLTIDAQAEVIEGALVSSDTTTNTVSSTVTQPNSESLPAGTTVVTGDPVVSQRVTTTADDNGDAVTTTVTTTAVTTTTVTVTEASDSTPSSVTTQTDTVTTVETVVTKTGLVGVTLSRLQVALGYAQVRPDIVDSVAGTIVGEGMGGGVWISSKSYVEMDEVFVFGNRADKDGGGIWNAGSLTFTQTAFSGNFGDWQHGVVANMAGVGGAGSGGGIFNSGALKLAGDSINLRYYLPGGQVVILGNAANGSGGGIYSASGRVTLDCVSVGGASSYYVEGWYATDPTTGAQEDLYVFGGNQALNGSGGGIYLNANNLQTEAVYLYRCDLYSNIASQDGGGLYFTNGNMTRGDALVIEWSDIYNNVARNGSGGGIYITASVGSVAIKTVYRENVEVNVQSLIYGNKAGVNGGALAVVNNKGNVTVDFIRVSDNQAGANGGAFYIANSQNVTLIDMEISNNRAGGTLNAFVQPDGSTTYMMTADRDGSGGGIYYTNINSSYKLDIQRSSISYNTITCLTAGSGLGGGIYLDLGTLSLESSTMAYNGSFASGAYALGGAIYMKAGTLTVNFSTLAYNRGRGSEIYVAGSATQIATLNVANSIIYNSSAVNGNMIANNAYAQIYLAPQNGGAYYINANVSTSTNIYSHYFKDAQTWESSIKSDGRTSNALTISGSRVQNGSGWVNGHKVIAASAAESLAIQKNIYLDTELEYHANFRTQALAIISQNSWAYNVISAGSVKYDQRGNLRVDPRAWTWDPVKNMWVQGAKTKASIGAFEPIFYLEVTSKGDDSKIKYTGDANSQYLDAAYGDSGLTLREATYWVDSRAGLLRLGNNALDAYVSGGMRDAEYLAIVNEMIMTYNRYYTGISLYRNGGDYQLYGIVDNGTDTTTVSGILLTDQLAGLNANLTYNEISAGSLGNPASFGYLVDNTGSLVRDAGGKLVRISTTGSVGFDQTLFAAGQDNQIHLTHGEIYFSRGWRAASEAKDFVIGAMYGLGYRGQSAADRITVVGDGATRVFTLGGNQNVVINNLTITGGKAYPEEGYNAESDGYNGGGIWNAGTLTLNNARITGNEAENVQKIWLNSGYGGGLFNAVSGMVFIYDTTIDGNEAIANGWTNYVPRLAGVGAGVYNAGTMLVERSNISNNNAHWSATVTGAVGVAGGGFYNTGVLKIANSTIARNETDSSTLESGIASGSAVYNAGTLLSYNNTVFANKAQLRVAALGNGTELAAIYNADGSRIGISNTIAAENVGQQIASDNRPVIRSDVFVGGSVLVLASDGVNGINNIIGAYNVDGYNWNNGENIVGGRPVDANGALNYRDSGYGLVKSLRLEDSMDYNGGKTMSFRVLGSSVALENGVLTQEYLDSLYASGFRSIDTDQRGVDRLLDGNGNTAVKTNIGAFETISLLVVSSSGDVLAHQTGFDYANNVPLWESVNLTLREALYLADDGTTIVFKSGWQTNGTRNADGTVVTNGLTADGRLVITLQGQLEIVRDVTINGNFLPAGGNPVPGVAELQIASGVNSRLLYIQSAESGRLSSVSIYNMSLSGGRAATTGGPSAGSGGAIYAMANLTLDNVTITDSRADNGGFGGGIYLTGGLLAVNEVTIADCLALYGGGIYVEGYDNGSTVITATRLALLGNTATSISGLAGAGGGLYVRSGNASLSYVTIGNNRAGGDGGGIYLETGRLNLYNSTVANNTAGGNAGGIYFRSNASLNLNYATVANNRSGWSLDGKAVTTASFEGGGIYLTAGVLNATNSLVAQNFRGAMNLATGVHDDIYAAKSSTLTSGTMTYNVFGRVMRSLDDGGELRAGGTGNYFLNVAANNADWYRFGGISDGYTQLLDTKLANNGGFGMTVYVNALGNNWAQSLLNRAVAVAGTDVFDQTQLEIFDGNNGTLARRTVGAYEKQQRVAYYVQGDIKGNALSASQWISANGAYLLERDGILNASDTTFTFEYDHPVTVNTQYGDRVINQLMADQIVTSTGEALYYTRYFGPGKDALTVTYFQDPANAATIEAAGMRTIPNYTDGRGTLVGNWTLSPNWLDMGSRSRVVVDTGAVFTIAADVVFDGQILVRSTGTLELATTRYDRLGIRLDGGATTVAYTSALGTQSIITRDYAGQDISYDTLRLDGGAKASVKTFSGNLNVKSIDIDRLVTLKVNAVTNSDAGDLNISSGITGNGDAAQSGRISAAGSIFLGTAGGSRVTIGNVVLDAGKAGAVYLYAASVEMAGNATIGTGATTVIYSTQNTELLVTGYGNQIHTNMPPSFRSTAVKLVGGELVFDFGRTNLELSDNIFRSISVDAASRLAFVTTGKLSSAVLENTSTAAINGTLALYGTMTVDGANGSLLRSFQNAAIELGGKLTLTSDLVWTRDLTINGAVSLSLGRDTSLLLKSSAGRLAVGGYVDPLSGEYIAGNGVFAGAGKELVLEAADRVFVGGLNGFKNVTVDSQGGNIGLGGSITATGDIVFRQDAEVLQVFDAKGKVMTLKLQAGNRLDLQGLVSAPDRTFGELQFQASNRKGIAASSIGGINVYGAVNFLQGNFDVAGISAGALTSKATAVNVAGGLLVTRNTVFDNVGGTYQDLSTGDMLISGAFTVAGDTLLNGGSLTNNGTLTLGDLRLQGRIDQVYTTAADGSLIWQADVVRVANLINKGTLATGDITLDHQLSAAHLGVGGALVTNYYLAQSAGSITNTRNLTATGAVTLNGFSSLANNSGTLIVGGANAELNFAYGSIMNKAALTIGDSVYDSATQTTVNTGRITQTALAAYPELAGGTLENRGKLTVFDGITLNIAGSSLSNLGGTLAASSIMMNGDLVNRAAIKTDMIDLSTGTLENRGMLKEAFANNTRVAADDFVGVLTLRDGASLVNYGTLSVDAVFSQGNPAAVVDGVTGSLDSTGSVENLGGVMNVRTLAITGVLTNRATLNVGGALVLSDGYWQPNGGAAERLVVGSLRNYGTIGGLRVARTTDAAGNVTDAYTSYADISITGAGTLENYSGRRLTAGSISLVDGNLTNYGTMTVAPVYTITTDSARAKSVTQLTTGDITISGKGALSNNGMLTAGGIEMAESTTAGGVTTVSSGDFSNVGTVNVTATVVKGSVLVGGKPVTVETLLADGEIRVNGNLINYAGRTIRATSLAVNGVMDNGSFISGGSLTNYGTISIAAKVSTVTNSGVQTATIAGDGSVVVYGGIANLKGAFNAGSVRVLTGDFINEAAVAVTGVGVVEKTATGAQNFTRVADGSLTVESGKLVNAKGRLIKVGSLTMNGDGSVDADNVPSGSIYNQGTITAVANGVLTTGSLKGDQLPNTISTGMITMGAGTAEFSNSGTVSAAGINMLGAGSLGNYGTMTVRAVSKVATVAGVKTVALWGGDGSIALNGGNLVNARTITAGSLSLVHRSLLGGESGNLTNTGMITLAGTAVRVGSATELVSTGNLTVGGNLVNGAVNERNVATRGTIRATGVFHNAATQTGEVSAGGDFSNLAGSLTASGLNVTGDVINGVANTTGSVASTLTISPVAKLADSGRLNVGGALDNRAGTVTVNGTAAAANSGNAVIGGVLTNSGTMTFAGDLEAGSLVNNANRTLTIRGAAVKIAGAMSNNGTITAAKAAMEVGGSAISSGRLTAASMAVGGEFENRGTVTMTGDLTMTGSGEVINNFGKTMKFANLFSNGNVTNYGTLTASGSFGGNGFRLGALTNSGTLNVSGSVAAASLSNDVGKAFSAAAFDLSGDLSNYGKLTAKGAMTVGGELGNSSDITAATLDVTGAVLNLGKIQVKSNMKLHGADVTNSGSISVSSIFDINRGKLYNNGAITAKTIRYTGASNFADHYTGNRPSGTPEYYGSSRAAFASLANRATSFNAVFDGEAGQALEELLAF